MIKRLILFLATALAATVTSMGGPVKVIFDTDMGNDVDDCLAMEVLYRYMDRGKVDLLGVLSSKREIESVQYLDILNTCAGHTEIPLGIVKTYPEEKYTMRHTNFAAQIVQTGKHPRSLTDYESLPDGYKLARRLLAENGGKPDITVVAVGFSTNLKRLMESVPDEISPLSGMELIRQNVCKLVMMAGDFHRDQTEYNVRVDVPSARTIMEHWPTPVIISDHEIGYNMRIPLTKVHGNFGDNHPVTEAFDILVPSSTMPTERPLHDPAAVLFAVELKEKYASLSPSGKVTVRDDAMTLFTPDPAGDRRYILHDDSQNKAVTEKIFRLTKQPGRLKQ